MNKENILALADHLDTVPDIAPGLPRGTVSFDMGTYFTLNRGAFIVDDDGDYGEYHEHCGTAACIAGHTIILFGSHYQRARLKDQSLEVHIAARRLLELDADGANKLFEPPGSFNQHMPSSAKQAARTLRRFAGTGEVDWTTT